MGESGPTDPTLPLPRAALQSLLSVVPPGVEAELRSAGRAAGGALARRIGESSPGSAPSWEAICDAWRELGLGRLHRLVPGPGLLQIVNEDSGLPSVAPEFTQGLLEGLFEGFVSEPVGVTMNPVAGTIDDAAGDESDRYVVGAPELIARLKPGLDSGRSIEELMEEAWR
jgi:hypothetical protein